MAEVGKNLQDKTALFKHREWRGFKDTAYDYGQWMKLWGMLLKFVFAHPVQNVKAILRYRWMFTYLTVPSFFDRVMSGAKGAALRAGRNNLLTLTGFVTDMLTTTFSADLNLHPNSEKAKKKAKDIIFVDELLPALVCAGFPKKKVLLYQVLPMYLPSLINQHSPVHYISETESFGLPADVCPLPSFEAGVAIDDDYPKEGCCFVSCNMPCDGSIMTSSIQDRRHGLPVQPLNIPLRWKRDEVQEYAVAEIRSAIEFIEKHTGEKYDWDALRKACEIWNGQTRCKMEKWEYNLTDIPPHTGSSVWLYRIFEHQVACGKQKALDNDIKVNKILREQVEKGICPKTIRHRAVIWNTPCNNYGNFNNWLLECWGIDSVAEMIDIHGTTIIDTSSEDSMLYGVAKMVQEATMRAHTKGGYQVILDDLWLKYEEYNADMIIMFDQISCKGVGAINGLFEEGARKRGIKMIWVRQDLMDPTSISRRDMRDDVNRFMQTVMNEKPLDPSLVDFDDSLSW